MNYWEKQKALNDKKLSFSKSRLKYFMNIYDKEIQRKQDLERKSLFYLSFVTILLGSIFLNLNSLEKISILLDPNSTSQTDISIVRVSFICLGLSIFVSLIGIFQSLKVENYVGPTQENSTYHMFGPNSNNIDEIKMSDELAQIYSIAAEANQRISNKKAMWTKVTSLSSLASVVCLGLLAGEISYLSIQK